MRYKPELDGIRALSVLAVMAFHAKVPGLNGGFLGVDVFFVLSGFLITHLLVAEYEDTGSIGLLAFYGRRLRRLYPALLLMVAVYLALAPLAFPQHDMHRHFQDAGVSVLYLSDYARLFDAVPVVLGHTWSLAIEEQFYLLWPLLLLVILRLPRRTAVVIVASLAIAATLWRWANVLPDGSDWRMAYNRFDTHASGLLVGCLAALMAIRPAERWAIYGFAGLVLAMLLFRFDSTATAIAGFTVVELSAALVVMTAPRWLGAAPLAITGRLSYGLYLWHFPAMLWMRQQGWGWPETFVVGSAFAFVAAWVSYTYVECWFRKRGAEAVLQPALSAAAEPIRSR